VPLLILDTAPNADQTALRAAQSADLVLIPCRAATFDLEVDMSERPHEMSKRPSLFAAKQPADPQPEVLTVAPPVVSSPQVDARTLCQQQAQASASARTRSLRHSEVFDQCMIANSKEKPKAKQ
jgi:cellulose biosynthesis protein BcsQ